MAVVFFGRGSLTAKASFVRESALPSARREESLHRCFPGRPSPPRFLSGSEGGGHGENSGRPKPRWDVDPDSNPNPQPLRVNLP